MVGLFKPYEIRRDNKMELINEIICIVIMYHIFCFTDYIPDPQIKYNLGFSVLFFNTLSLSINLGSILKTTYKTSKRKLKLYRLKKNLARQRPVNMGKIDTQGYILRRIDHESEESNVHHNESYQPAQLLRSISRNSTSEHLAQKQ